VSFGRSSRAANCDAFHYASSDGTVCEACPSYTRRFPTSGADVTGSSPSQCLCERGFYSAAGLSGTVCVPCPVGGVCDGGITAPYPQRGFFGDPSSALFLPCSDPHACLGGSNFSCGEEWTGVLCGTPSQGRFEFGSFSVECPSSLDSRLRLGSRQTEVCTAAVIVAAAVVLAVICRMEIRDESNHEDCDTAWYCLQVLALAVRMRNVPWPPLFFNGALLVADTVLLDLRPIARLILGCASQGAFPSVNDDRALLFEWVPTFVAIGLVVVVDVVRRGMRLSSAHVVVLLRTFSPILVLAACEVLICRTVRSLQLPTVRYLHMGARDSMRARAHVSPVPAMALHSFPAMKHAWYPTPP